MHLVFNRLLARFRCLRGKHTPLRKRVRREALYHVTTCSNCGTHIRKRNGRTWEPYKP
jgi:transcription elongation factor Elf1